MSQLENTYEYELIDIAFEFDYEQPEEESNRVSEENTDDSEKNVIPIEYDEDGIPKGNTAEEIKMRKQIIFQFYEKWKNDHPEKAVFNKNLNEVILIRKESVVEASGHAPKRYKSTLAVLRLDEVLSNAVQVAIDNPKPGNKNQAKLIKMILMSYNCPGIGTIKLTVGVRRQSHDKIQYGITAINEGEKIEPINSGKKKKAPHKK